MDILRKAERFLTLGEEFLLSVLVTVMVLLAFLQVLLRTFWSTGLFWADPLLRHMVLWVAFLGAGLAASTDKQFALDASSRVLRGAPRTAARTLCHVFAAGVCVFLCRASFLFLKDEYLHASPVFAVGSLQVPAWTFETILPAGFAVLALHYLLKTALETFPVEPEASNIAKIPRG